MTTRILTGDCREILKTLADNSVNCVVTSPPYFGLRDYGTAAWEGGDPVCDHKQGRNGGNPHGGLVDEHTQRNRDGVGSMGGNCAKCGALRIDSQIGLEASPAAYVAEMVQIFREVRRVLAKDGTLWLNLGDSYAGGGGFSANAPSTGESKSGKYGTTGALKSGGIKSGNGLKSKDLVGIPWRVAFALQDDGWYLRQDIIWHKLNPMPESVRDRCTKAHEYVFLLSKSARYFYDGAAIAESAVKSGQVLHSYGTGAKHRQNVTATNDWRTTLGLANWNKAQPDMRNKRSVWSLVSRPFPGAHFATFPPKLVELCLKAGCPAGGTVLDPFGGAGTTSLVADRMGLDSIMIELNAEYAEMAKWRLIDEAGMFAQVAAE